MRSVPRVRAVSRHLEMLVTMWQCYKLNAAASSKPRAVTRNAYRIAVHLVRVCCLRRNLLVSPFGSQWDEQLRRIWVVTVVATGASTRGADRDYLYF